jgi:hypothetical protein
MLKIVNHLLCKSDVYFPKLTQDLLISYPKSLLPKNNNCNYWICLEKRTDCCRDWQRWTRLRYESTQFFLKKRYSFSKWNSSPEAQSAKTRKGNPASPEIVGSIPSPCGTANSSESMPPPLRLSGGGDHAAPRKRFWSSPCLRLDVEKLLAEESARALGHGTDVMGVLFLWVAFCNLVRKKRLR